MKNIIVFTKPTTKAKTIEAELKKSLQSLDIEVQKPIVIAIGGDGTMLMAIKEHELEEVSFIGISAGHLGFLQTLKPEDISLLVDSIQKNSFTTISAPLLGVRYAGSKESLGYGFNDITIERSGPRAARFELHIDDNVGTFIGDGIIFSTPLGSTAYSLAAGGPIIDTKAQDVFVVSPSNPHISTLYSSLQRPHVLQKGRIVKIESTTEDLQERPIQLSVDGQVVYKNLSEPVEVYVSDKYVSLLELKEKDFHSRIDKKRLGNY
jgi:NAD+ kinase